MFRLRNPFRRQAEPPATTVAARTLGQRSAEKAAERRARQRAQIRAMANQLRADLRTKAIADLPDIDWSTFK